MRRRRVLATVALTLSAAALAGCSVLPQTGGKGEAAPVARTVRQALTGDAEQAANALVDAWRDNDRAAADRIATEEAVNAIFASPYPDAPPRMVSCSPDDRVPEGRSCFFQVEGGGIVLRVLEHAEGGWEVRSLTFLDR